MSGVASGAALTVLMRWADRLIGFVSTMILARLLVPEDFGIIAMASLVIGLVDTFLNLGVNVALIQNKHPSQEHYNTAWTLGILQAMAATLLVIGAASWAATYFKDPRITVVVIALAPTFLLGALQNIGIVNFQKEMRFADDFKFLFARRIFAFAVTMCAAWTLRSYWALVIGSVAGATFGMVLSYFVHPMRPRLSTSKFSEIFSVSQWVLLRNVSLYIDAKLHIMLVGRRADAATMGAYTLADEIAAMPTSELLAPLNRVLFPAMVRVKHDFTELKRIFLLSQGIQAVVGLPAAVGLALVAGEAVPLLLGDKWLLAIPIVQILAVANVASAFVGSGGYVLVTLGRIKTVVIYGLVQVTLFALLAILALPTAGALDIAWMRFGVAITGVVVFMLLLKRVLVNLRLIEVLAAVLRPILCTGVMAACVSAFPWPTLPIAVLLLSKLLVATASYVGATLALWTMAGRPEGAESYLIHNFKVLVAARTKRSK